MTYASLVLALATALPAAAQAYGQDCNANGYVVTANRGVFQSAPVYLGKSCDAFHKAHDKGTWCWQNAALNEMDCSCIDFSNGGN